MSDAEERARAAARASVVMTTKVTAALQAAALLAVEAGMDGRTFVGVAGEVWGATGANVERGVGVLAQRILEASDPVRRLEGARRRQAAHVGTCDDCRAGVEGHLVSCKGCGRDAADGGHEHGVGGCAAYRGLLEEVAEACAAAGEPAPA